MSSSRKYIFPGPNPFLGLQRNAIVRSFPSTAYEEQKNSTPFLYQKPEAICLPMDEGIMQLWGSQRNFSIEWRRQIRIYLNSYQLNIRLIVDKDTPQIQEFFSRRYSPAMASEICSFDLFRIRNFGHGLILEDQNEAVQGTIFGIGYDTPEKTSYTIRLAVAEELAGKNLGLHLMLYSCLLAMEQGSLVKRGIIQADNLPSLYVNLNKVGWICDKFEPHINGLGAFFHIALPLDSSGLTRNIINFEGVKSFIQNKKSEVDYKLLDCKDLSKVEEMYRETDFKIVALLKGGLVSPKPEFLAIPAKHMGLISC